MPSPVSLVIPVRDAASAKSRLATDGSAQSDSRRRALAAAIALDTVEAARGSQSIGELIVVGSLADTIEGVRVVDDPGMGLITAIGAGLALCDPDGATAVLLGDLPALHADDLDAALLAASEHHWAFVADAEEAGTTLVVAQAGLPHSLRFGVHSAAEHSRAGYAELPISPRSGLRRDVDTVEQLRELRRLDERGLVRLGPRTRRFEF